MALNIETIKKNEVLGSLTDDQVAAIVALSKNDEDDVIGKKIGEIYRNLDSTIEQSTGIERNGDEKTYKYLERATGLLKNQLGDVEQLKQQLGDLTNEKTRLEKVIKDGATDTETKKQLDQATADLQAIKTQYNDLKTNYDNTVSTHKKELFSIRVDNELSLATSGIKFKPELPKSATDVLLQQANAKIKSLTSEYIDNGNGGKVLAFKDENGAILRNPENQLNPFTASELINKELKGMGVLDEGRKVAGAGSSEPTGNAGVSGLSVDLSGAKTRVEAHDLAVKSLLSQGLINGSKEFQSQMTEIWKDNNISQLPEK